MARRKDKDIEWVLQATSKHATRPRLAKPWIETVNGQRYLCATDGHRMHLLSICKEKEITVDLAEDHPTAEDQLQLFNRSRRDDTTKVFSLAALQYTVTEQAGIQLRPTQDEATIALQNFLTALKHDNTPNNRLQVTQAVKKLKEIFQKYDRGVFGLNIKALLDVAIGVNVGYLNDALNMVKYNDTTVSITFAGPLDPIYVHYEDPKFLGIPTHIALIMPMRI